MRCRARDVSRSGPAGDQAFRLRARGERDARACRSCARPSITARRSISRAPAAPMQRSLAAAIRLALGIARSPRVSRAQVTAHARAQALRPALPARPERARPDRRAPSRRSRAITSWRSARAAARSRARCSNRGRERATLDVIEIDRDLVAAAARRIRRRAAHHDSRSRCAGLRFRRARRRARRTAAHRRQPALQHLDAAALSPARAARSTSTTCT